MEYLNIILTNHFKNLNNFLIEVFYSDVPNNDICNMIVNKYIKSGCLKNPWFNLYVCKESFMVEYTCNFIQSCQNLSEPVFTCNLDINRIIPLLRMEYPKTILFSEKISCKYFLITFD